MNTVDKKKQAQQYFDQAEQHHIRGELEHAAELYIKSIELYPEYVQAIHNRGVVCEFQGKLKKAREFYLKAIEIDNNYMPSLNAINSL